MFNSLFFKKETPNKLLLHTIDDGIKFTYKYDLDGLLYFLFDLPLESLEEVSHYRHDISGPVNEDRLLKIVSVIYHLFTNDDLDDYRIEHDTGEKAYLQDYIDFINSETNYLSVAYNFIEISDGNGVLHRCEDALSQKLNPEVRNWFKRILYYFPTWEEGNLFPIRCNPLLVDFEQLHRWINETPWEEQIQILQMLQGLHIPLEVFVANKNHFTEVADLHLD